MARWRNRPAHYNPRTRKARQVDPDLLDRFERLIPASLGGRRNRLRELHETLSRLDDRPIDVRRLVKDLAWHLPGSPGRLDKEKKFQDAGVRIATAAVKALTQLAAWREQTSVGGPPLRETAYQFRSWIAAIEDDEAVREAHEWAKIHLRPARGSARARDAKYLTDLLLRAGVPKVHATTLLRVYGLID